MNAPAPATEQAGGVAPLAGWDIVPPRMSALPATANDGRSFDQQIQQPGPLRELHAILRSVAHDLRTPLSTIMNCMEILDRNEAASIPLIEQIKRSAARMNELIGNMLVRARQGADLPRQKWVDMPRLLERIRNEVIMSRPTGSRPVKVRLGNAPWVFGDPIKIGQVFTNLMANAVKFSGHARDPQVVVSGDRTGTGIHYAITDNGIGIHPEGSKELFEPFKRMKNATHVEGTGVGLAIVKEIMDGTKGRIWYSSIPGVETSFHLAFPKGPEDDDM